ncbi:MAG: hypothetical protein LBT29_01715 [Flavobacteriaceae bacterium]|jgi:hypothetical protein|nr:hypothetical protein [Flavobacteriaceae bacterium]
MKEKQFLTALFLFIFSWIVAQNQEVKELEKFLSTQDDLIYNQLPTSDGEPLRYELRVKQPVDWKNPKEGYFFQRVILTHVGFDRPTLIETQGYQIYDHKNELQQILNSNDLNVEHRYFGESKPDSIDWKYLNLYNVAHDLHHINRIFRKIYKKDWISTGISKGGQTTIYYRYFFPDDVNVSIPYVTPINYTLEDKRIYNFLENVGTLECRQKIKDFQIFMLKNEDEALKYVQSYAETKGLTFNYLGSIGKSFEYSVFEYSFSFWQWGYSCNQIPQSEDVSHAVDYLMLNSGVDFFSDQEINNYASHYYQAATEMGYYGYDIQPFKKYLHHLNGDANPLATFAPKEAGVVQYNEELNNKLKIWLETQANNIIYIYGGNDTWSATKVVPSPQTNSVILELPGANHASARIENMNETLKNQLSNVLYDWIHLRPDYSLLK